MSSQPSTSSVRVGRTRRLNLYVIGIGVWLSGGLWLFYHYFLKHTGPFGPQVNPLEPWLLKIHAAFAFAAVWIFGLFWGIHVRVAWPYRKRRWSGGAVMFLFLVLGATGYLLYYVGDDRWRNMTSITHWAIGLGAPLGLIWHRWRRRSNRQQQTQSKARTAITSWSSRSK